MDFKNSRLFIRISVTSFRKAVAKFTARKVNKQVGGKFMARRRKPLAQQETQGLPLWAQIAVVLWMLGVLVWFFSDYKIQQWLAVVISDLTQWH